MSVAEPIVRDRSLPIIMQVQEGQRRGFTLREIARQINVHPIAVEEAVRAWLWQ